MAWISVHENIVGAKLRQFRSLIGCSQWEAEGILVSLWLWGLNNADKYGLIPYADRSDIEIALSGSSKGSTIDLHKIVDSLVLSGWIDEADDGIYIHDWEVWQEQWYKAKERREKDTQRKRENRSKEKAPALPVAEDEVEAKPPVLPPAEPPKVEVPKEPPQGPPVNPKRKATNYGPEFDEFWTVYPRKVGKGDAAKAYQARRNDGWSAEILLTAAKNYALQCNKQHTAPEYIKHPKTFLSVSTPFTDYVPKRKVADPEQTVPDGKNPFSEYGKEGS